MNISFMRDPFLPIYGLNDIPTDAEVAASATTGMATNAPAPNWIWPFPKPTPQPVQEEGYIAFLHPSQEADLRHSQNIFTGEIGSYNGVRIYEVRAAQSAQNKHFASILKSAAYAAQNSRVSQFGNIKCEMPPDVTLYTSAEVDAFYNKLWSDK